MPWLNLCLIRVKNKENDHLDCIGSDLGGKKGVKIKNILNEGTKSELKSNLK